MTIGPIDLRHQGLDRIIAVYVVETDNGLGLFDCGPSSTIGALKAGLAAQGLELQDIRYLLLSHVHLDHAGAAAADSFARWCAQPERARHRLSKPAAARAPST